METEIITPKILEQTSENLLDRIRDDFIGLNTKYTISITKSWSVMIFAIGWP